MPSKTTTRRPEIATARTCDEWKCTALDEDERSGAALWRRTERSHRYDYRVIRRRHDELRSLRQRGDPHALIRDGERATWPKIAMIRNCTLVGRTLDRMLGELKTEVESRATRPPAARNRGQRRA